MSLGTSRTPEKIQDIIAEINLETTYFNGRVLKDYIDENEFPATAALLAESFHDLTVVVLQQKQKFDRVRPNKLDPTLETVIAVPGHPAYPSGHSTQMHFIAYVLSELAPARRAEFLSRADQIAHNREIAGLHYPSDSAAGVLLAQQFFDIMMQNEKFKTLLAVAKEEWATHPALVQAPTNP
jgi:acid phosphatase (class A)